MPTLSINAVTMRLALVSREAHATVRRTQDTGYLAASRREQGIERVHTPFLLSQYAR